ncbi:MAG: response regulator [Anaerolineales bacterium]|jgi:DNA-binding response OmpR family regulator
MSKPLVLLIDDEIAYAEVIGAALKKHGFEVVIAGNAGEALELFQQTKPSLILLDVMMPEIDGLTLLKWLREHSEQDDLPIHVVSAKAQEADKQAALKAGANGFIAKPFSLEELLQTVGTYLPNGARSVM